MTMLFTSDDELDGAPPEPVDEDRPRKLSGGLPPSDKVFNGVSRAIGVFVLALTASIGLFLGQKLVPTLSHYGFGFFTQAGVKPQRTRMARRSGRLLPGSCPSPAMTTRTGCVGAML